MNSDDIQLNESATAETGVTPDGGDTTNAEAVALLVDGLKRERDDLKEQILRIQADNQNILRRIRQQMDEDKKFAAQPFIEGLLPVLDNFSRSLEMLEKGASVEKVVEGIKGIERMLQRTLESEGVERIATVGQPFDPNLHEALLTEPTTEVAPETVVAELQSGYLMHGRVLRAAQVKVSVEP